MDSKGTIFITGGAQRIGQNLAIELAKEGYDIALHYNTSLEAAQKTAETIQQNGSRCELIQADFNQMEEVRHVIPAVIHKFPDCRVLINNASIFEKAKFIETDEDLFDRHFQINFKTPFFLTRDFARTVKQGHVINIIDTKAARTVVGYFAYTLTKKTLLEFTRMAAKTLAPEIRVNGVAPGLILPPSGSDESYLQKRSQGIPLKTYSNPKSIFHAVRYLLDSDFITGECLFVDGGEHLK